ncbi:hypothetical protein QET93_000935 [Akkermansia sp. N21116]|uniref:hypothetical protein n=1 Tax=Akkermansia sp. N21116 TaxID=3040764 RepID=UPI00244EF2F1|nr:hypothetical protein [Akkermansia sp. N21116]WPX40666.1 hypothetical protein QET93_000935 [Akkermansia sp. N21116]
MSLDGIKKYNLHSSYEYDIAGLLLNVEFYFYTTDKLIVRPSLSILEEYYVEGRKYSPRQEKIWVQACTFWNPHSTITADSIEDAIRIFEEYLLYRLGISKNFSKESFAKITYK